MGILNSTYRKAIIDEIIEGIQSNTSHYYGFISSPLDNANNTTLITNDDYSAIFEPIWKMMFGKKLQGDDVAHMIQKNIWKYNTVYEFYDNTKIDLRVRNLFYVISQPMIVGDDYNVYICIDNNGGAPSLIDPGTVPDPKRETTFQTSDNYKWRYVCSSSDKFHNKFATSKYFPVKTDTFLSTTASQRTGIEKIVIVDGGEGYESFDSGFLLQAVNTSLIQLSNSTNKNMGGYFDGCDIYFTTGNVTTSEIHTINSYITNTSGTFVYLSSEANTTNFIGGGNSVVVTSYSIAPRVVIKSDGNIQPTAYCTVNANTGNSIMEVVVLETGNNITWANAVIVSNYGRGANIYCVVPPPGGFGSDPASELNVKGIGFSLDFINTESNTIIGDGVVYNKFGIIKNPHSLNNNLSKGNRYTSNTFNQLIIASLSSPASIPITNEQVVGMTSGARGVVVSCNTTHIVMTGDKHFINGEVITTSSNGYISSITLNPEVLLSAGVTGSVGNNVVTSNTPLTTLLGVGDKVKISNTYYTVQSFPSQISMIVSPNNQIGFSNTPLYKVIGNPDIYTKDLYPLYAQNINSVTRSDEQTELFKLIVRV